MIIIAHGNIVTLKQLKCILETCEIAFTDTEQKVKFEITGNKHENNIFLIGLRSKLSLNLRFDKFDNN